MHHNRDQLPRLLGELHHPAQSLLLTVAEIREELLVRRRTLQQQALRPPLLRLRRLSPLEGQKSSFQGPALAITTDAPSVWLR